MIIRIIVLIILVGINGILSASEIAYISLDKYSISRKKDKKSKKITNMLENENKFLSTIQIGITFAGFLASAFAADSFTDLLIDYGFFLINDAFTENFLMIIITLILSYFTLIFGELVPKKIGLAYPYKLATITIDFISAISIIANPLIILLTKSTEIICKLLKIKERDDSLTENDIKKMIITGSREGILEEKEKEYILNIFKFNDKTANKIMTPKNQVVTLDTNDTMQELIRKIKSSNYTRFPVLNNNKVIGFINIKDFIYLHQTQKKVSLNELIRPVLKFNKNEKIDDIFRIMQEKHETFSIILDKNEFIGILTMEDAIEEIVGNIEDEYN
ncbi:MAG: hemolysin family protein [Candidatus Coprovivens sp.]